MKLTIASLSALLALSVSAQTPTYVCNQEDNKDDNLYTSLDGGFIGKDGNKLYCSQIKRNAAFTMTNQRVLVYDATTLKLLETKELGDSKNKDANEDLDDFGMVGNRLYSVVTQKPKKTDLKAYLLRKHDATTLEPTTETIELFSVSKKSGASARSANSPSNKYCAYGAIDMENGVYKVAVFDDKLNLTWQGVAKVGPFKDVSYPESNVMAVNDKGEVAIVVVASDYKNKKSNVVLVTFNSKGEAVMSEMPGIKNLYSGSVACGKSNVFTFAGLLVEKYNSDVDYARVTGYAHASIKDDLSGLEEASGGEFGGSGKEKGIERLVIRRILETDEGNAVLVLEVYGYYQSSKGRRSNYHYTNLIINTGGGKDGDVLTIVPKSIETQGNCNAGAPLYFTHKNHVYIVTNDSNKNLNLGEGEELTGKVCDKDGNVVLIDCDIDAGKFTKTELSQRRDIGFMYIDMPSLWQEGNTVYFNSMVGGPLGPGGTAKLVFDK